MNTAAYVGYIAGAMTIVSYIPQAVRAWKTKKVEDLSWGMFVLIVAAGGMWIAYGLMSSQLPVVVTNVLTVIVTGTVLAAKIKYR